VLYQFAVYKQTKFNDPLWIKSLVCSLFLIDTVHSIVGIVEGWQTAVTNYGNIGFLANVSWTIPFTAVATSLAAVLAQIFLIHRVFKLTRNTPIAAFLGILSLLGFAFGVFAGVDSGIIQQVKNFGPLTKWVVCWLSFSTAADVSITVVLIFVLCRSRSGFRRTDTIVNRLIRGAIQTGAGASVFSLADLFCFVYLQKTLLYAMFAYPIGRIYSNTLLDTLNCRVELKNLAAGTVEETGDCNDSFRMKNQSETFTGTSPQIPSSVHVDRKVTVSSQNHLDTKFTAEQVYTSHV